MATVQCTKLGCRNKTGNPSGRCHHHLTGNHWATDLEVDCLSHYPGVNGRLQDLGYDPFGSDDNPSAATAEERQRWFDDGYEDLGTYLYWSQPFTELSGTWHDTQLVDELARTYGGQFRDSYNRLLYDLDIQMTSKEDARFAKKAPTVFTLTLDEANEWYELLGGRRLVAEHLMFGNRLEDVREWANTPMVDNPHILYDLREYGITPDLVRARIDLQRLPMPEERIFGETVVTYRKIIKDLRVAREGAAYVKGVDEGPTHEDIIQFMEGLRDKEDFFSFYRSSINPFTIDAVIAYEGHNLPKRLLAELDRLNLDHEDVLKLAEAGVTGPEMSAALEQAEGDKDVATMLALLSV